MSIRDRKIQANDEPTIALSSFHPPTEDLESVDGSHGIARLLQHLSEGAAFQKLGVTISYK